MWFKLGELRMDDNEALVVAHEHHTEVLHLCVLPGWWWSPLDCDDGRRFARRHAAAKVGGRRRRWLLGSVMALRRGLRAAGSELVLRRGPPAVAVAGVLAELGRQSAGAAVYTQREVCPEEQAELAAVAAVVGGAVSARWGGQFVVPPELLPYQDDLADLPDVFTEFRTTVEGAAAADRAALAARCLDPPAALRPQPEPAVAPGDPPPPAAGAGVGAGAGSDPDPRSAVAGLSPGEPAGQARLVAYFAPDSGLPHTYKGTRNGMLGRDYSTKLSLWLADGSLSPRRVLWWLVEHEAGSAGGATKSSYWIFFELLVRDFFRLQARKWGPRLFAASGPQRKAVSWLRTPALLAAWKAGRTGYPLVDACMRELAATGFMSNRGRQIVASFLTKDLGLDWRLGAAHFEEALLDYDAASNWSNWAYAASVGCDPRGNRYFCLWKQGTRYDRDAAFIKAWLPELAALPAAQLHDGTRLRADRATGYPQEPVVALRFEGVPGHGPAARAP